jgi:hypothetical protein
MLILINPYWTPFPLFSWSLQVFKLLLQVNRILIYIHLLKTSAKQTLGLPQVTID